MVRRVIATEGIAMPNGRTLRIGALKQHIDKVPVTINFHHENLVGWADRLKRDETTHEVSMEIELFPDVLSLKENEWKHWELSFVAKPAEEDLDQNLVTYAVVREIVLIPLPGFPKGILNDQVPDQERSSP